jgi:predicted nucleic acid-binding protein
MDETERVMRSDKFGLSDREVQILTAPVFEVAEIVIPVTTLHVIERCPADNRVLECAIEGKCSAIVSGDRRDLLSLKHYRHVEIITPRQFLERVE